MESARCDLTAHRRWTCRCSRSRQRSGTAPTADHRGFPVRGSSTLAQASSARRSAVINQCCSAGGTDPGLVSDRRIASANAFNWASRGLAGCFSGEGVLRTTG